MQTTMKGHRQAEKVQKKKKKMQMQRQRRLQSLKTVMLQLTEKLSIVLSRRNCQPLRRGWYRRD